MLVKELISLLQKQNPDAVVLFYDEEMESFEEVAKVGPVNVWYIPDEGYIAEDQLTEGEKEEGIFEEAVELGI